MYSSNSFLDSLIFNDSVDAYQNWTLFLIFVFILVLIGGVVLLTHKKPDAGDAPDTKLGALPKRRARSPSHKKTSGEDSDDEDDHEGRALRAREEGLEAAEFELGEVSDSDDEDVDGAKRAKRPAPVPEGSGRRAEEAGLMVHDEEDGEHAPAPSSVRKGVASPDRRSSEESDKTLAREEDAEEFGEWKASEVQTR